MLPRPLDAGRFLGPSDLFRDSSVAVISASLARTISAGADDAGAVIGTRISGAGERWTIVGVLGEVPADPVNRIWVPFTARTARLLDPDRRRPASIRVRVESIESVPLARTQIESWLAGRFGPGWAERIDVASNRRRSEQARQAMLVFKLVLGAIAAISLVVGGIGIMNVLLASVSERTREIGMRKAAGATGRDIRLQFLAESLAITGVGTLLGILLGMLGAGTVAAIVRRFTDAPVQAAFTWQSVALAVSAAFLVGLTFGMWPARRAAHMSPIEALRAE
jgi:putative ABC transport system permease protein